MNRYFSTHMPFLRFAWNTLVVSLVGMVPVLLLYVVATPGFTAILFDSGPAMSRFLRQVATNGIPVVFVVNYVSYFTHAVQSDKYGAGKVPLHLVLFDLPLRVFLFMALHAVIYVLSADWFGSFGGDRLLALRAVAQTLMRSAFFENLSGVYFLAIVFAALPLQIPAIERALARRQQNPAERRHLLPSLLPKFWLGPLRIIIALLVSATLAMLLTGLSAGIVLLQNG